MPDEKKQMCDNNHSIMKSLNSGLVIYGSDVFVHEAADLQPCEPSGDVGRLALFHRTSSRNYDRKQRRVKIERLHIYHGEVRSKQQHQEKVAQIFSLHLLDLQMIFSRFSSTSRRRSAAVSLIFC